jgi:rare lipoprotein A
MEVFKIRRLVLVCVCATGFSALTSVAGAAGTPEVTDYPSVVPFDSPIEISGRVLDGSTSTVTLQRRFAHDDGWKGLAKARPDSRGQVSFRLETSRYTGDYRLKSSAGKSDDVRVRVEPRLTLKIRRPDVMTGKSTVIKGTFRPAWSNRQATLKMKNDGEWDTFGTVKLADGRFKERIRVGDRGRHPIKAIFERDVRNSYARDKERLRVHGRDMATWYGPGFFGNRTACGQTYHRELLGVAHRSLPCGTKVSVLYKGRSVKVPVVDRGPYGHANWDLTEETAQRLRFSGRQTVGVLH